MRNDKNINSNIEGLSVAYNYKSSHNIVKQVSERLSTGMRINRGADGPSDFAISMGMKAHFRGTSTAIENIQDSLKWMYARDTAMNEQYDILMRARELAVRAANDATLTDEQRTIMNNELSEILGQMESIGRSHKVNGHKSLFDPGMLEVVWVLDVTGSMGGYAASLDTNKDAMYTNLAAEGFDLQMGITGFDDTFGWGSSETLHDNAGDFDTDIDTLRTVIGPPALAGGRENGIAAINDALTVFGPQFRPDSQRVVILITDEDSDDFGATGNGDPTLNGNPGSDAIRQACADNLAALDCKLFNVGVVKSVPNDPPPGTHTENTPDMDYQDVLSKLTAQGGTGGNYTLTADDTWVNQVTSSLLALGGPWESSFHFGPESDDWMEVTFQTVTSVTSGASAANIATAAAASNAIGAIDDAISFVSEAKNQIGYLENQFEGMLNDYTQSYINTRETFSNIAEADFAQQAGDMAKQQIILNATQSAAAQANALPAAVIELFSDANIGYNPMLPTNM